MLRLDGNLITSVIDVPGGYQRVWDESLFRSEFVTPIRSRAYVTRAELLSIGRWKAVRAIGHMDSDEDQVKMVSQTAFSVSDPGLANWILRHLSGVGAPMASAALTVYDDTAFTVIDVRAMATLRLVDFSALDLETPEWLADETATRNSWVYGQYVRLCRTIAGQIGVTLRDLDRALWALNGRETLA